MLRGLPGTTISLSFAFRYNNQATNIDVPQAEIYNTARTLLSTEILTLSSKGIYKKDYYIAPALPTGSYFALATGLTNSELLIAETQPFEVLNLQTEDLYVGLGEVKAYMGITDHTYDDVLRPLLRAALQHISTYCARSFNLTTHAETFEIYQAQSVQLKDYPVISIVGSTISVESRTFYLDTTRTASGTINFVDIDNFQLQVEYGKLVVEYTAGFLSVPEPIRLAAKKIVSKMWNIHRQEGITSERLGDYTFSKERGDIISDEIKSLLLPYRKLHI